MRLVLLQRLHTTHLPGRTRPAHLNAPTDVHLAAECLLLTLALYRPTIVDVDGVDVVCSVLRYFEGSDGAWWESGESLSFGA